VTAERSPDHHVPDETGEARQPAFPPGIVAGTVLRSARLSAGLGQAHLAAAIGADEATVRSWEDGSLPLASAAAPHVERLEKALRDAGAEPDLVADLAAGAWCDLVILAIADSEDVSCLMADPLAAENAFAELLAWSIADQPPLRHRPFAPRGRLLPVTDISLVAAIVQAVTRA
jgi:transcriptional regulator with XRE-family HTH domain